MVVMGVKPPEFVIRFLRLLEVLVLEEGKYQQKKEISADVKSPYSVGFVMACELYKQRMCPQSVFWLLLWLCWWWIRPLLVSCNHQTKHSCMLVHIQENHGIHQVGKMDPMGQNVHLPLTWPHLPLLTVGLSHWTCWPERLDWGLS